MHIRVFTLRFDDLLGRFDDALMLDFIKDKQVITIRDHFFMREGYPFLAVIITYSLPHQTLPVSNKKAEKFEGSLHLG